jgi:hypothetical protein
MPQKRDAVEAVGPLLGDLGLEKRAGQVFTIELAPGVLGWLGLNRATQHRAPGEVEVNPVVGIRFQEVERVVAECRGDKFHAYLPATVGGPLGYLMPEKKYKTWVFDAANAVNVAADMAGAIAAYGLPFMRSVVALEQLRQQFEARSALDQQLAYRRPVAAMLAGDDAQARALLDQEIAAIGGRTDLAAADFKRFAAALRSRLKA